MQSGMKTLRQDGWRKILEGVTTVEEIIRVTHS
jgi:type II secretory ATPase GspE/PulE/Tfp pilus assembly ATPase PilB-like protein